MHQFGSTLLSADRVGHVESAAGDFICERKGVVALQFALAVQQQPLSSSASHKISSTGRSSTFVHTVSGYMLQVYSRT